MSLSAYVGGVALLTIVVGATTGAAWLVTRALMPPWDRLARSIGTALLATALLIAAHLVPLVVGSLTRGWVAATAVLTLAFAALTTVRRRDSAEDRAERTTAGERPISTALAVSASLATAAALLAVTVRDAATALDHVDMLGFHLPVVADWIQSGSAWQVTQLLPQQAQGAYPHNGDVLLLAAILPWHSDFLVRLVEYPLLGLAMAALYAASRELGSPRSSATLVALAVMTMPAVMKNAVGYGMPDTLLVAAFACALLFLLRHARTGALGDLVLAGVGLGLGFGTKWYGVSSVAVVLVVWGAAQLWRTRSAPTTLPATIGHVGLLGGVVLAVGGFWLLRNAVETGNPVFPVEIGLLGWTLFDGPPDPIRQQVGFSVASYAGDPAAWREHLLPAFRAAFGAGGAAIAAGAAAAVAISWRQRWRPPIPVIAMTFALLALVYAITPYTALGFQGAPVAAEANARYAVPALMVAAAMSAWVLGRAGSMSRTAVELALAVGVAWGLQRALSPGLSGLAVAMVVLGLLALVVRRASRASRAVLPAIAGAATLAAAVGGFALARAFEDDRYSEGDPAIERLLDMAPGGRRIGLAGSWDAHRLSPIWPAYGSRLDNEVRYLGRTDDGMLSRHTSYRGFKATLDAVAADYVVMGLARDVFSGIGPREVPWLQRAGYRRAARSSRFIVFASPSVGRVKIADLPQSRGRGEEPGR